MKRSFGWFVMGIAIVGSASSAVVLSLVALGARRFHRDARLQRNPPHPPPVSILKPLHGIEPQLRQNLDSFFEQDYPDFEILLAADREDDSALPIARAAIAAHPNVAASILVHGDPPWLNPPAYSFACMAERAHHDILVTSDSDVEVPRNYLREVTAPFTEKATGMVTCVYRGKNTGGFASALDAIGMSVEMTAGVLMVNLLEGMKFGLGPTIAVRRNALEAAGGYRALADVFSNDFVIGNRIAEAGYRVVLSRCIIDHVVPPMTFRRMWQRQVRWATGTRFSRPKGHAGTIFVFSLPYGLLGVLGGLLLGRPRLGAGLLLASLLNRLIEAFIAGYAVVRDPVVIRQPWLFPLRDLLGFAIWIASYLGGPMYWRDGQFELIEGGRIAKRKRDTEKEMPLYPEQPEEHEDVEKMVETPGLAKRAARSLQDAANSNQTLEGFEAINNERIPEDEPGTKPKTNP